MAEEKQDESKAGKGGKMQENKSLMERADEVVKRGGILAKLYFDIHAKSEEGLNNLAVGFTSTLDKEEGVVFAVSTIEKPMEEEGVFSSYVMSAVLFKDYVSFMQFVAKYTPLSVEIVKPEKMELDANTIMETALFISEVLYDMKVKMYEKTLSPQEKAHVERMLKQREELGKKLLNAGDESKDRKGKENDEESDK